jgi:hypothetical protein
MNFHVVTSKNPYTPRIGDLLCGFRKDAGVHLALEKFTGDLKDYQIIPLACLLPNPWQALGSLQIYVDEIKDIHDCPYTGYAYYSLVPTALLSKNLEQYEPPLGVPFADYAMDAEWHLHMSGNKPERLVELTPIQKLLLGSGYTHGTRYLDGHGKTEEGVVNLDNGDLLWVHFWEWYNK